MLADVIAPRRWRSEGELSTPKTDNARDRFRVLAEADLDRAYRLAGLLLSDRAEAEDAVQDALLRAWRSSASLRDESAYRPWFDRILVNVCRDRLRRRRRIRFVALDEFAANPTTDPFRAVLNRDAALAAINVLNPEQRVVVVLHYWAGLTLAEVAGRTGWRIGTVKSRLHQALNLMRDGVENSATDVGRP